VTEWWRNDEAGVEQGWTVETRPEGAGALRLVVEVEGAAVTSDGDGILLQTQTGRRLAYGKLKAWDAKGQTLTTRLVVAEVGWTIEVEDDSAEYPVTVDPLLTAAAWTAESNQASARFGTSVATAGDVNGDGFSDVVVGASAFDNGEADEGRVFVYQGSATGLASTPSWTAESNQARASFGSSVASAGDVNGDGFSDVVVGAPFFDNGQADEGRAFVYLGSATGLAMTPAWTVESNSAGAQCGYIVASAGDVNGDGFSDVLVEVLWPGGPSRVNLYLGGAAGLAPTPGWTGFTSQAGDFFGFSVASAGDVNGDGFSDVVVGAPRFDNGEQDEGRADLYLGSASGLAPTPSWTVESNQANALFGTRVASAGDVNGDGFSDVVVGAPFFVNGELNEGRAFVYLGSATGLSSVASWTGEANQANAQFGASVASAGDVNGDGFSDVVVGAPSFANGELDEGRAFVYLGSATGLSSAKSWTAESNQANAQFGASVASAGDVNGDGLSDVVVGASNFANGELDEGRAFVYLGSAIGLSSAASWTAESNQTSPHFGVSVASAGDVNGDGFSDVVVGANLFSNGELGEGRAFLYLGSATGLASTPSWTAESNQGGASFGVSVASAGDVNGDGFSDVVVGAFGFSNGETSEGGAFLYLGSASGLSSTPSWTAESNQANAALGRCVASAGDVNGDGFSDVVVGASRFSNGEMNEGGAFLYLGSAAGLSSTPSWTAESNWADAQFGTSVASAGDVNGDGFSDVVVGALRFGNGELAEGGAFLYLGSAAGLSSTPSWTAESDQAYAEFATSVASAGDVNGDGFSDVVVGAWLFFNGESSEGRAFLYLGSATGLSSTPSWTAESNQGFAYFGSSVASAGDVNGDGFSDVVVAAYNFTNGEANEGRTFLYLGSATGLSLTPAWTAESNQAGAQWGFSVASAGDVNGDGFSDVVVGAWNFSNGETREGRASVFLGGDGSPGRSLGLIQRVSGTPVGAGVRTTQSPGLELRLVDSLAGLQPIRFEVEVKPVGVRFNGGGTASSAYQAPGVASVSLSAMPAGLYHWRGRLRVGSPQGNASAFLGRWTSFGGNREDEADFVIVAAVTPDAGPPDAGIPDAGTPDLRAKDYRIACGCGSTPTALHVVLAFVFLCRGARKRR
jgi:hypothetical protein